MASTAVNMMNRLGKTVSISRRQATENDYKEIVFGADLDVGTLQVIINHANKVRQMDDGGVVYLQNVVMLTAAELVAELVSGLLEGDIITEDSGNQFIINSITPKIDNLISYELHRLV